MGDWLYAFYGFVFPVYCPVCGIPLQIRHQHLCLDCEIKLPRTNYTKDPDNAVAQQFWGRVNIEAATSLFRFEKGSAYQSLLHELKYRGNKPLGIFLGKLLGEELLSSEFNQIEYIVPVPLHKKKQAKRGYNQCEIIGKGLAEMLGKPLLVSILERTIHTATQTRKSRMDRWRNTDGAFQLAKDTMEYAHSIFLLLDDVTTTGATLEACSRELLKIPGVKVYIATLACA